MVARPISGKRYAQAVFELARERKDFEVWLSNLEEITKMTQEPKLVTLLESPRLPLKLKMALVAERLKEVNPLALNLAYLLIKKGRLRIADQIATEYKSLLDAHYGIEHAEVTTAFPLNDRDKETISVYLNKITGKKVIVEAKVNPNIIGGIVIRIGDKIINGSIQNKLETLRKELIEARS